MIEQVHKPSKMADSMLKDVAQAFDSLRFKYPFLKDSLVRCYKDIEKLQQNMGSTDGSQAHKKQKLKGLLESSIDLTPLNTTYEGLLEEMASNETELIEVLKNLSQAIINHKKKILFFAAKQGQLLKRAKDSFHNVMYRHIRDACQFSSSYANFLISLFDLFEKYPKLCYCGVPIRVFCSNMKIIREICDENEIFWSHLS